MNTAKMNQNYDQRKMQRMSGRLGVIMSYSEFDNTATVAITKEQTDEIDEILTKVPCPVMLGIQTTAPSPGRQCWVVFKDDNVTQPLITHYYNYRYSQYDYPIQTKASNSIPTYLLGM